MLRMLRMLRKLKLRVHVHHPQPYPSQYDHAAGQCGIIGGAYMYEDQPQPEQPKKQEQYQNPRQQHTQQHEVDLQQLHGHL
ncbi:unnamed protein product [Sphacelaria rigidula]